MTPHEDKISMFLEELKQTSQYHDPLPDRILRSKHFALAWVMLAGPFRKNKTARVVPNDVLKDYNGSITKPVFYAYLEEMCKMNHIMKLPGTGNSRMNPLVVVMKDEAFIHASCFNNAMSVLGKADQRKGG